MPKDHIHPDWGAFECTSNACQACKGYLGGIFNVPLTCVKCTSNATDNSQ